MAECSECGAQIDPSASECPECGEKTHETESFAPVAGEYETASDEAYAGIDGPALVVYKGLCAGERFYVDRPRLTLGRDPQSDVFLNDVTVSRDHAVLTMSGEDVTLADSGSLNGTYVNNRLVETAVLRDGDEVQIGTFCMKFVGPRES